MAEARRHWEVAHSVTCNLIERCRGNIRVEHRRYSRLRQRSTYAAITLRHRQASGQGARGNPVSRDGRLTSSQLLFGALCEAAAPDLDVRTGDVCVLLVRQ
jgi:hypothetical protein